MSEKVPQGAAMTVEDINHAKYIDPTNDYSFTSEEEKQVLRKLDRVILPLMALVYFFQCKSVHAACEGEKKRCNRLTMTHQISTNRASTMRQSLVFKKTYA
jgi:hypothetical protein